MNVDKLKIELFKKQKSGFLDNLFALNPNENQFTVAIALNNESKSMVVPYRNIKCKLLQCLYDEDELIQLYSNNNKKMSFTFSCKFCKTKIDFKDFFLDEELYEVINRLFGCYNKVDLVVQEVVLSKDGGYFPQFLRKPGATIQRESNLPTMRNYSDDQHQQMLEAFEKKGKNAFVSNDVIITRMGLALTFEQYEMLQEEQTTSIPLMAFLINYAYNFQENLYEKKEEKPEKRNVCLIALFIYGLTKEKQLDSEYLANFENYYSQQELIENYETVAIVIFYEKVWSLLIVNIEEEQSHFYIFKDHMKDEYSSIISAVIAEQFDMKDSVINYVENFSFHSPSEAKYSGTLVFRLLMWLIDPPNNPQPFSDFNQNQIDIVKKQTSILEWLLFSMMEQDKKTAYIFAGMKQNKPNNEQESVPSIISLQGIHSPSSSIQINESYNSDPKQKKDKKKKKKTKKKTYDNAIEEVDSEQENVSGDQQFDISDGEEGQGPDEINELEDSQFNFQKEFDKVKQKYEKKGIVRIPKQELDSLVEKLQYDVSKEIQRKRKQEEIEKETLADYYIDKKIQEFDVKIKNEKLQKKKKKKKRQRGDDDEDGNEENQDQEEQEDQDEDQDLVEQYEIGQLNRDQVLEKQKVQLSMLELKTVLKQFEVDMHKRINFKHKYSVQDAIDREREANEYMEWYNTFVQLLHYYYNYDIETYKQLIDEYNFRYHNMIFHKLGLDLQATKNNPLNFNQYQPNENQKQNNSLQPYNQMISNNMLQQSKSFNNGQFQNQNENGNNTPGNTSIRNSVDFNNNSQVQFNRGSVLAKAGQNITQKNKDNGDLFNMGQRYNEQALNSENSTIIATRYQKVINDNDLKKLRSGNILSEDGLNFFIKYLEERFDNSLNTYRINQKPYPKGMRTLYLSTNFYRYFTKDNPLQMDYLDFKSVRHYMKQYTGENNTIFDRFDKICVPIIVQMYEIHLAVIDLHRKELVLYVTSNYSNYPKEAVNNPILSNLLRFIQKELYEKKMKNLNFIGWLHRYIFLDETFTQKYKQSILNTAFLLNIITKHKDFQYQPYQELISFSQRLVRLFTQIGITKNQKNELIFENLPI